MAKEEQLGFGQGERKVIKDIRTKAKGGRMMGIREPYIMEGHILVEHILVKGMPLKVVHIKDIRLLKQRGVEEQVDSIGVLQTIRIGVEQQLEPIVRLIITNNI